MKKPTLYTYVCTTHICIGYSYNYAVIHKVNTIHCHTPMHFLFKHAFLRLLFKQNLHSPQFEALQPSHFPQRFLLFPITFNNIHVCS